MEWSFPDHQERYKASLQESDGKVTVSSLKRDGTDLHLPEMSVESHGKKGSVIVNVDG